MKNSIFLFMLLNFLVALIPAYAESQCSQFDLLIVGNLTANDPSISTNVGEVPPAQMVLDLTGLGVQDVPPAVIRFRPTTSERWIVELEDPSCEAVKNNSGHSIRIISPVTAIAFSEDKAQANDAMFSFQPCSSNQRVYQSFVRVRFEEMTSTSKPTSLSIKSSTLEPGRCFRQGQADVMYKANGGKYTPLLEGVSNPPGGFLYEPDKSLLPPQLSGK